MYVIREVLNCKPGKVRQMVEKFRSISTVLKEMGQEPLRVLDRCDGRALLDHRRRGEGRKSMIFSPMEQTLTTNETLRKTMADYHDLVDRGRREIYRLES